MTSSAGIAVNAYNDGPTETGEVDSPLPMRLKSSPLAAFLRPGETLCHTRLHPQGTRAPSKSLRLIPGGLRAAVRRLNPRQSGNNYAPGTNHLLGVDFGSDSVWCLSGRRRCRRSRWWFIPGGPKLYCDRTTATVSIRSIAIESLGDVGPQGWRLADAMSPTPFAVSPSIPTARPALTDAKGKFAGSQASEFAEETRCDKPVL